ncbi:MAG: DUF2480 family protein [Wenyingzhuangia sp.]|jgi:hypothetical protein|tara:strand:- start:2920 stop:3432 length:513 start_codon:yes stop_codon:yes gene_type:complete
MEKEIINKVANSGLINLDLADYYPKGERVVYDIKQNLWQEFVLKEKDFRLFVKENDWSVYQDKYVALINSADAIVPSWAFMILTDALEPFAKEVVNGDLETMETVIFLNSMEKNLNPSDYKDQRVIIKGCGEIPIPDSAYVKAVNLLKPVVKSLMYGEACSAVPVFKKRK